MPACPLESVADECGLTLTNFPLPGERESFLPDCDSQSLYLFNHETYAPRDQTGSQRHLLFYFWAGRPLRWKAGQYLHYILNHPNPDDRGVERYFSIASAPHEKNVMLTTRFAPKGSSFKKTLKKLKPGDVIEAREKGGDFILDHRKKMFVFIAGGIGITPFRAILLDLDRNRKPLNVQLLYTNRNNDFPYRKELETLKNTILNSGLIMSSARIGLMKKPFRSLCRTWTIRCFMFPDPNRWLNLWTRH